MIPIFAPSITKMEKDLMLDALDSGWISGAGKYIDLAENLWAAECESRYAITVANGTVALQLLLHALGIGPGDEVLVPNLTYVATANAVLHVGARPVFIDVEENSWCMNPDLIEQAIGPQTRAILVTHLQGHPCDVDRIRPLADKHGLALLGDAAQAHFATYKNSPTGGLLDAETFSFHVGKILTCGEGGMITTNNKELAGRLRFLKSHGMDPGRRFFHPEPAFNFRMTNTHAGFLCAQIQRKDEILARRKEIFDVYDELLGNVACLIKRPVSPDVCLSPWVYTMRLDDKHHIDVESLIISLYRKKIESRPMYYPLSALPMFIESKYIASQRDVSRKLAESVFYLPTYHDMENTDIEYICTTVKSLLLHS